ncbi:MAG: GMC family oxidoreductase [Pseudolabrys sp.]
MERADIIIVGAGSAGAALAARLSEEAALRVLLIEAGKDTPPGAVPKDIAEIFPSAFLNRSYFWPQTTASMREGDAPGRFPQARVMGGGSSVMGMIALRGLPSDYDGWERMGARNWGWRDVLPYFRGMTCDIDQDAAQRNAQGPNIIHRLPREVWPLYVRRAESLVSARGARLIPDVNGTSDDGFFATPLSQDDERATSARCYLTGEVRARPNLSIMTETRVTKLTLDGARVTGVVAERDGETKEIHASEVVLCAGAIHSPTLMLRSGIGPVKELQRIGIAAAVDRPGVGRNFQNHSLLHFALTLKPESRLPAGAQHYTITGLRFSSGVEGCPAGDLFLYFNGRVSARPFGTRLGMIAVALYAPLSRGAVSLTSADPDVTPRVDQRLLSDPRDAERMVIAARYAESLIYDRTLKDCYEEAYLLPRNPPLRLINDIGMAGTMKAAATTAVLRAPAALRRAAIGAAIRPGRMVADEQTIRRLEDEEIIAASGAMFHPSGTCAIGGEDNKMAVVDPECRVYGVQGLRVADASVMPSVPSANTNIPTIMIAERAADFIKAGFRRS